MLMLPLSYPKVSIMAKVPRGRAFTVRSLCRAAKIPCRVTGPSTKRRVYLRFARELTTHDINIYREPGVLGAVTIETVPWRSDQEQAVQALGALAYAVFDYAARESLRGRPEAKNQKPVGRPKKQRPLTGAERQRRWRERHEVLQARTSTRTSPNVSLPESIVSRQRAETPRASRLASRMSGRACQS